MKGNFLKNLIPLVFSLAGLSLIFWWVSYNPVKDFSRNLPGMDNQPAGGVSSTEKVEIGSIFTRGEGIPSKVKESWPGFRGLNRNNISPSTIKLKTPDNKELQLLWSIELGEGHAGPVVYNGKVYLLDYDEKKKADMLRCLSLDDGKEIWSRGYKITIKRNHGISRTVPAVTDRFIVSIGPKCQVMCLDSVTGDLLWGIDLEKEYDTEVPLWYAGQCPVIDGTTAIIAPGGKSLLIGIDCESGKIVWETPNPDNWKMSHASILPVTLNGEKIYIYSSIDGLVGVSGKKETAGKVLFKSTEWAYKVIAPSPVYLGQGRFFMTAGYGKGSMVLKIQKSSGSYSVSVEQIIKSNEGIASEQQTPVFYKNHLFSILPKDAGKLRNQFVCVDPVDCKKVIWASGKEHRFGLGPYLVADGKFFILDDDGMLTVIKADTKEYKQLAQQKILEGVDAWGPMVMVEGRLLARDSTRMVCLNFKE